MGDSNLPPEIEAKWLEVQDQVRGLARWRADDIDCWLRLGMILHWWACRLLNHDVDLAEDLLDLWISWSRQSHKFEEGVCESKWATFHHDRESVLTLRTLLTWAEQDRTNGESQPTDEIGDGPIGSIKSVPDDIRAVMNANLRRSLAHAPKLVEFKPSKPPTSTTIDTLIKNAGAKCGGTELSRWPYSDRDGDTILYIVRFKLTNGDKAYRQFSKSGSGWVAKGIERNCPLYRLPELMKAASDEWIVLTEGEKAADAAMSIGFVATTSCQGALSRGKSDWAPLAGRKVLILPDNDSAGQSYVAKVVELMSKLNPQPTVKILNLPGLPEAGDLFDFVEARR
jgi:hypothetical protein